MASVLAKPPQHQPQSSPSMAPSPVSLLPPSQTALQPSTRLGMPAVNSAVRSQSPTAAPPTAHATLKRSLSPEHRRSSSWGQSRPTSVGAVSDAAANLNGWSPSTAPSKSSATSLNTRRNSIARRLSGSFGSLGSFTASQSPPTTRVVLKKPNPSLSNSPPKGSTLAPANSPLLPKIPSAGVTLQSLAYAVTAIGTPAPRSLATHLPPGDVLASSVKAIGASDHFPHQWGHRSSSASSPQRTEGERRAMARPSTSSPSKADHGPAVPSSSSSLLYAPMDTSQPTPNQQALWDARRKERERGAPASYPWNGNRQQERSDGPDSRGSAPSNPDRGDGPRRRKIPSQKAMLAKALQKAKHAVTLDHAQNYEGANAAYCSACELLLQVMIRSHGADERQQLEGIRNTYENRIRELQCNELQTHHPDDKALPDVPSSTRSSKSQEPFSPITDDDGEADPASTAYARYEPSPVEREHGAGPGRREPYPRRRRSLLPSGMRDDGGVTPTIQVAEPQDILDAWTTESPDESFLETTLSLPVVKECLPPPLSPRRPHSPGLLDLRPTTPTPPVSKYAIEPVRTQHARQETAESTSWLDTIDESGGSSPSSVHPPPSSLGFRPGHRRTTSGATDMAFDSAVDAAIAEAYHEGFESVDRNPHPFQENVPVAEPGIFASEARRNVELAKERAREAEREAIVAVARAQEQKRLQGVPHHRCRSDTVHSDYDEDEAEEEERILEAMTREYILDDSDYNVQTKSALPRQSDSSSSGCSGRTWATSFGSNPTGAAGTGASLSPVTEVAGLPSFYSKPPQISRPPPTHPPPSSALPPPPTALSILPTSLPPATIRSPAPGTMPPSLSSLLPPSGGGPPPPVGALPPLPSLPLPSRPTHNAVPTPSSQIAKAKTGVAAGNVLPGVRERRLSGQPVRELTIDTTAKVHNGIKAPSTHPPTILLPGIPMPSHGEPSKPVTGPKEAPKNLPGTSLRTPSLASGGRQVSSPFPGVSPSDPGSGISPVTSASSRTVPVGMDGHIPPIPSSPTRMVYRNAASPKTLRKNFSSSSLKSIKQSFISSTASDDQPGTPLSRVFSSSLNRTGLPSSVPDMPTPTAATLAASKIPTGGMHYLDTGLHSHETPGRPNPVSSNGPLPLEACPEPVLLRPYWLLRCLYHTMAHPRGGYISQRLFVPRDIWFVRNVKLKAIEEKASNCDLLTAALHKLSRVDTLDADAVYEEMQSLDHILDQVQSILTKKLGDEVGIKGSAALFKSSSMDEAGQSNESLHSRNPAAGSKSSSLFRKLRSKNSSRPSVPTGTGTAPVKDVAREMLTIRSVPMTNSTNPRFPKRDPATVQTGGPYAQYMGALVRLCDATQVLDHIARQVEDPGLKHSNQTHVGLELSARHASEFFGFYICSFVLNDVSSLLDKFIKRGGEWVNT